MIKSMQNLEKTVQQLNEKITGYELLLREKDEIILGNSKRLADLEKQVASVRSLEEKVRIIEEIKKKEEMPDTKVNFIFGPKKQP